MNTIKMATLLGCVIVTGCSNAGRRHATWASAPPAPAPTAAAPVESPSDGGLTAALYPRLGALHRPISTRSADAQKCFDQALTLTFGFNHDEAIRLYGEAARRDPGAAMPWWGIAYANGPHINNPAMTPERSRAAWDALQKARALMTTATPIERDLIEALSRRYAADPAAPRQPMDEAYAAAMRDVWQRHQGDADVGVLAAEAMMDLHPWDLWTVTGKPKSGTEEIVQTLEAVLARWPDHPGANHLYIHAIEASPFAERAVPSADRLRTLVPDSGHLVHMPAHIYIRVGRFADASRSNEEAMAADARNGARFPKAGFYRIYMAHNAHFLAFSSMMEGRYEAAMTAARKLVAEIPPEFIASSGLLIDGMLVTPLHVMVRFGRWEDILKEKGPERADLVVSHSVRHYARGIALTALGRIDEAKAEQKLLEQTVERVTAEQPIGNNPAKTVLRIPVLMLSAEIAFREGRHDVSFSDFQEAIAIEDGLVYDEPPDWMQPVRHAYGASLLAASKFVEAEAVFREDLVRFPENGWSLTGLAKCLAARGVGDERKGVVERVERAWSRKDVEIESPCFCQPHAAK